MEDMRTWTDGKGVVRQMPRVDDKPYRDIVEDPVAFAVAAWRGIRQKDISKIVGAWDKVVRAYQYHYGIPVFHADIPLPVRSRVCAKSREVVQIAAWRAYVRNGLCPVDCPLHFNCELHEGSVIGNCVIGFYFAPLEMIVERFENWKEE